MKIDTNLFQFVYYCLIEQNPDTRIQVRYTQKTYGILRQDSTSNEEDEESSPILARNVVLDIEPTEVYTKGAVKHQLEHKDGDHQEQQDEESSPMLARKVVLDIKPEVYIERVADYHQEKDEEGEEKIRQPLPILARNAVLDFDDMRIRAQPPQLLGGSTVSNEDEDTPMRMIDRSPSLDDRRPSHPVPVEIPTRSFNVVERQPQFVHVLSRSMKYPFSDVRRFYFPDFLVDWQVRIALDFFFYQNKTKAVNC